MNPFYPHAGGNPVQRTGLAAAPSRSQRRSNKLCALRPSAAGGFGAPDSPSRIPRNPLSTHWRNHFGSHSLHISETYSLPARRRKLGSTAIFLCRAAASRTVAEARCRSALEPGWNYPRSSERQTRCRRDAKRLFCGNLLVPVSLSLNHLRWPRPFPCRKPSKPRPSVARVAATPCDASNFDGACCSFRWRRPGTIQNHSLPACRDEHSLSARWRKSCSKAQTAFERFPVPAVAHGAGTTQHAIRILRVFYWPAGSKINYPKEGIALRGRRPGDPGGTGETAFRWNWRSPKQKLRAAKKRKPLSGRAARA